MNDTFVKRGSPVALALVLIISLPLISMAQQEQRRPQSSGGMFEEFPNRTPKVGEMAPDFTLRTVENETFTLSEAFAKGPVVIEFGSYT
ncbi:hypothetical protein ACFL6T_06890 [Candidatus Zixiibacteriota bacterium]